MNEGLVDIKGQTTPPWKTGHTSKTLNLCINLKGSPRDGDARGLTEKLSAVWVCSVIGEPGASQQTGTILYPRRCRL